MRWQSWAPATACALFSVAALWQVSLPGLQYDESLAAAPAVNFVRGTENAAPMHIRPSEIHILGRPLPVMVMTYIGPIKTLFHIPLFALLGISPLTMRLLPILALFASMVLLYHLCSSVFDQTMAAVSVFALALDPSWVFLLTRDVGPAALAVLFKLVAVAACLQWWRTSAPWAFALGCFTVGLGISHKADFVWVVVAMAAPLAALAWKGVMKRLRARTLVLGLLAFAAGALPMLLFTAATRGLPFLPFLHRLLVNDRGSFVARFPANLGGRLRQVMELLDGTFVYSLFTGEPLVPGALRIWWGLVGFLAIFALTLSLSRNVRGSQARWILGMAAYLGFVLLASCFSPTGLAHHHLLALYPIVHGLAAVGLVTAHRNLRWARRLQLPAIVVAGLLVLDVHAVFVVHRALARTGGSGFWSDAIYQLSDDLLQRELPIVLMDWGFTNNLIVASKGELVMTAPYREQWRAPLSAEVLAPYVEPDSLYLFHAPEFSRYRGVFEIVETLALERDLTLDLEKSFLQRDGREVYRLYRLSSSD